MIKIAIYYKKSKNETAEQTVARINHLINFLEVQNEVKGVFIDVHNESAELIELLNSPLSEINYIYINKPIENEFDRELIKQLAESENFKLKYFNEI